MVNNQPVAFPDQQPFINKDNRTLVPVRAPLEAARAAVTWNDVARQATVAKGDKTAVFTIGSKQYTVNGETKHMDTEAQIAGNRTVFPIRFVAEAIGLTVTWDENTWTVGITAPAATIQELLRHADISTTLNTYSHVLDEMKAASAERLDGIIGGVLPEVNPVPAIENVSNNPIN